MEPDSSLSWSQNVRIELLHIVDVHLSSDFIINFVFFFPPLHLGLLRCLFKVLKFECCTDRYLHYSPLHVFLIFFLILFNVIYFSKEQFVKFTTMHFNLNSS